ncbi:MAG: hypothetical protein RJA44_154 [Pseudomonadota bacterium]|jgi:hypothetical protein
MDLTHLPARATTTRRSLLRKVGDMIRPAPRGPVGEQRILALLGLHAPGEGGALDLDSQPALPCHSILDRTTLAWRLYPKASQWLVALPIESRPILTANRHPHIVNHLALIWDYATARDAYLKELLQPEQQERHEFSVEVLDELIQLCAITLGRSITGPALQLA